MLGVIGLGDIGRSVAKRASAHGMTVLGYDVAPPNHQVLQAHDITSLPLIELFRQSDFIALCCNLTRENRHMLSRDQFSMMKNGVSLVNTARGPLIDEDALISALKTGKVSGAALDVFEVEPLPPNSELRSFDNCIFGTHNSSNTVEAVLRVNEIAIKNLLTELEGRS